MLSPGVGIIAGVGLSFSAYLLRFDQNIILMGSYVVMLTREVILSESLQMVEKQYGGCRKLFLYPGVSKF
ncbi:hypothetical protein QQP08_023386 [Theobroma cacao]|nr:hypothetical protein QQP08_023386 [Theobroma cacao]